MLLLLHTADMKLSLDRVDRQLSRPRNPSRPHLQLVI